MDGNTVSPVCLCNALNAWDWNPDDLETTAASTSVHSVIVPTCKHFFHCDKLDLDVNIKRTKFKEDKRQNLKKNKMEDCARRWLLSTIELGNDNGEDRDQPMVLRLQTRWLHFPRLVKGKIMESS